MSRIRYSVVVLRSGPPSRHGTIDVHRAVSAEYMRFGISTHLYHDHRLEREHLAQIAAHGFESDRAVRDAQPLRLSRRRRRSPSWQSGWRTTGLTLHSVHAPITDVFGAGDQWAPTYSNAVGDAATRARRRCDEAEAALRIARRIPFDVLVVHLGTPASKAGAGRQPAGRRRGAASRRSAGSPSRSACGSRSR